ncbi:MAG: hypothetical protein ACFB9M_05980 [Myxococcota bacterium]
MIWVALEAPPTAPPKAGGEAAPATEVESIFEAPLDQVAENILDVPHTSFLHGGLFRTRRRPRPLKVRIERGSDRVRAVFLDEAIPGGLLGRALALGLTRGNPVEPLEHEDLFILPCVAEVRYRWRQVDLRVLNLLRPEESCRTRVFSRVWLTGPTWLTGPVRRTLTPIASRVLKQDQEILRAQTQNLERFEGRSLRHTDADLLGPHILRLLQDAVDRAETTPVVQERLIWT